jgi:acyl-CoA thioesterase FadM
MYPYFRLAKVITNAVLGRGLSLDDISRVRFLVWPGDVDIYPEMNNGRHLTIMDLGRADFTIRTGILKRGHERGWTLVAAGASVRFRHRLAPLRRFILTSRLLGHDDRWFYFLHETEQGGRVCSSALVRVGLRSKAGLVTAERVLEALGRPEWRPALPAWVAKWIEAEDARPKL